MQAEAPRLRGDKDVRYLSAKGIQVLYDKSAVSKTTHGMLVRTCTHKPCIFHGISHGIKTRFERLFHLTESNTNHSHEPKLPTNWTNNTLNCLRVGAQVCPRRRSSDFIISQSNPAWVSVRKLCWSYVDLSLSQSVLTLRRCISLSRDEQSSATLACWADVRSCGARGTWGSACPRRVIRCGPLKARPGGLIHITKC